MRLSGMIIEDYWFYDENSEALDEASQSFAAKLAQADGLKTFPAVAQQILAKLSSPKFEFEEVTRSIESDPSLAAGILRMANSPFFRGTRPISSIKHSLVRLGQSTVKEVILAVVTMDLFPDLGTTGKQIRDHCVATGAIAQKLAIRHAPGSAGEIFICGLLHDVGKLLLIESGEGDYSLTSQKADTHHLEERDLLGYDHAVLGAHVLHNWKLPSPVPKLVALHHSQRAYEDQELGLFVALLRLADNIEYLTRDSSDDWQERIERLAQMKDASFVGITADQLVSMWDELIAARTDALELFSS